MGFNSAFKGLNEVVERIFGLEREEVKEGVKRYSEGLRDLYCAV